MNRVICKIVCCCTLLLVTTVTQSCKTSYKSLPTSEKQVIAISNDHPYSEIIPTKKDAKDMSVQVKIEFDEPNNVLSVCLSSAHNLFGFKNASLYKNVIKNKKLSVEMLPYKVETEQDMTYKLSKNIRNNIPGSNSKHNFQPWISTTGLRPQTSDYVMVTDTLKQKFDIVGDTTITVCLGDIMMMERSVSKKNRYDLIHYTTLNKVYELRIGRNPCFGKDDEMSSAQTLLDEVQNDYNTLSSKYKPIGNLTMQTLQALDEVRVKLEAKYPKIEINSACPEVQNIQEQYNLCVDSIAKLADIKAEFARKRPTLSISADQLLAVAKMVDNNVASWLVSNDSVEKSDLVKRNKKLIEDVNKKLSRNMKMDKEQAKALSVFKKAEKYFNETCLECNKK